VPLESYLPALFITLAIEVPVVAALYRGQRVRMALACLIATTATHLAMHFLLPRYTTTYASTVLIGESGALAVEALVYALVSRPRDPGMALVAAACANAASYLAGLALL
jgi:hypothetical protein